MSVMNQQLQLLVAIQDLEQMIRDNEDEKRAKEFQDMGFPLGGLDNLKRSLGELESQLEPRHRSYYRKLTGRFGHAVVPVIGNLCMGCFASIPSSFVSVTHENRVLHCESCGRILYWP
ncbi:MAG: C4-type zinc ribbon domain-containing protein [Candidatus Krumholzibacteriia bacterium]